VQSVLLSRAIQVVELDIPVIFEPDEVEPEPEKLIFKYRRVGDSTILRDDDKQATVLVEKQTVADLF
jgi:hypothetical protein